MPLLMVDPFSSLCMWLIDRPSLAWGLKPTGDADAGAEAQGRHGHHHELAGAGESSRTGRARMNRQRV